MWENVPVADRYNIYFSTLPGVNRGTATKISGVTSPFRHVGLADDTTYYYIVTAENEAGESPDSNEVNAITAAAGAAPAEPVAEAPSSALKTTGVVLLIVGGVLQIAALSTASSAEDDAATALQDNDAELYQQALDDRDSAESLQGVAVLSIGVGVLFMLLGGNGSDAAASLGPQPQAPRGFQVDVTPHNVMAGYTMRW